MTAPVPCPVCGKAPDVCRTINRVDGKGHRLVWMVYCGDEGKAMSHHVMTEENHETSEDAIRAWNEALKGAGQ